MSDNNYNSAGWRDTFDHDVVEIEHQMMSFQHSNDLIRSRLHKVAAGLQAIQKCVKARVKPSNKVSKCPPLSKSALVVAENTKMEITKQKEQCRVNGIVWQDKCEDTPAVVDEAKPAYGYTRRRSSGDNHQRRLVDTQGFISCQEKPEDMYGSNRSINSIFRIHDSMKPRSRSRSESSIVKADEAGVDVRRYDIFSNLDCSQKPTRPNTLFITKHIPRVSKVPDRKRTTVKQSDDYVQNLEDYLSEYRNQASRLESKVARSAKAAQAIDSCILLMNSLIDN